jgi:hypothetical protein
MERTQIFLKLCGPRGHGSKLLFCAALKGSIEALARQIP